MAGGFSGALGSVTWTSKTSLPQNVHNWTVELAHDIYDVTPFSPASSANINVPRSVYGWSGTFDLYLDDTTPITIAEIYGAATSLVLTATAGRTFTGNAVCGNVSITCPSDGPVTATVNFTGTGALTPA